jgi:hypothetical protein
MKLTATQHCCDLGRGGAARRTWAVAAQPSATPAPQQTYELRVCTNKTCRRQGSAQIAKFGQDLALPSLAVATCGCLGSCGNGPNAALVPTGPSSAAAPVMLYHVSTPARLVQALDALAGVVVDAALLRATELRLAGNEAARGGDLPRAVQLYTDALAAAPPGGRHLALANRSAARLAGGDAAAALADAEAALACAPPGFTTACVRQADALFALHRYGDAKEALQAGAARHPPFGRSPEYAALRGHVERALQRQGAQR